jgi:hypothetical protein
MARYVIVVPNTPYEGGEDEYLKWYKEGHLTEFIAEGFVSAGRLCRKVPGATATSGYPVPEPDQDFVTMYEFETDDLPAKLAALKERNVNATPGKGYIDPSTMRVGFYEVVVEQS